MFDEAWQNVLEEIRQHLQPAVFATWFSGIKLLDASGKEVVIGVPSVFFVRQMETRYYELISETLKKFEIQHQSVKFIVDAETKARVHKAREVLTSERQRPVNIATQARTRTQKLQERDQEETGLNPRYRLENFIVGTNNDVAVSAAKYVVEHPGGKYNPYYLYGGPGLGKTHLIQAIGNELVQRNPRLKVLYTTTEQMTSTLIKAMRAGEGVVSRYRKVDVLIVDDIQMIAGKDKSQIEFFNIFNELYQKGKQVIVSSDRMPGQIATIDERLSSRLLSGIPIDIQMPDFETRCAILHAKAEWEGKEISDAVIEYIANNIRTNIRELEGKFNQLIVLSEVRGLSPDQIISDGYLEDIRSNRVSNLTPKRIIDKTADFYHLTAVELKSKSRVRAILVPRQVATYLMSEELDMSTPAMARELGQKDHTTVMNSLKKIRKDLRLNFQLREDIATIKSQLIGEK
jgi:chromosomal replication initiator protein